MRKNIVVNSVTKKGAVKTKTKERTSKIYKKKKKRGGRARKLNIKMRDSPAYLGRAPFPTPETKSKHATNMSKSVTA